MENFTPPGMPAKRALAALDQPAPAATIPRTRILLIPDRLVSKRNRGSKAMAKRAEAAKVALHPSR
jgi:hypothetical protein